jgi:hypothetical protein
MKILLPIGESASSDAAIPEVEDRYQTAGTTVRVLHVIRPHLQATLMQSAHSFGVSGMRSEINYAAFPKALRTNIGLGYLRHIPVKVCHL